MESFEFNETFFSLLKGQILRRSHLSADVIPGCLLFIYNIAISKRAWQLRTVTLSHANLKLILESLDEIPVRSQYLWIVSISHKMQQMHLGKIIRNTEQF